MIDMKDLLILEKQCTEWWQKPGNSIKEKIREHSEEWYTRTFLAVLFMFAKKWVWDWIHPEEVDDDYDDEDDD